MVVEESIHIVFNESNDSLQRRESVDYDVGLDFSMERLKIEDGVHQQEEEIDSKMEEQSPLALPPPPQLEQGELGQGLPREWKFVTNHPQYKIIGNPSIEVRTRSSLRNICNNLTFIFQIKPKNLNDAIVYENWVMAMQE